MKKIVSLVLCFALLLPTCVIPAFAAETEKVGTAASLNTAFADGENSLIIFVTGIGQSASYLFDESYLAEGAFENGTLQDYENYSPLIAEGKYTTRWTLMTSYFDEAFKNNETIISIAKLVVQLLTTLVMRKNVVKEDDIRTLVTNLFSLNLMDENGNPDKRIVTPRYCLPLSAYPGITDENGEFTSEAKSRFYSSIPCQDVAREMLGENYEDYLYCFNYNAFSYTSKNVNDLHSFIETALKTNKVGAEKVVLVPMSMGASVVSAYLAEYPNVKDNHVSRVVSIVGAWNGSDIMLDLINQSYADNSADLLYNGLIAELVGEPWGYLVNIALRLFSKTALRSFIDEALGVFVDVLILQAPSMLALVPDYGYNEVRPLISSEAVLKETDAYFTAQSSLKTRLSALEEQGVTFSFISGYGLPFGAVTSDYKIFGMMHSAAGTNGDEIINISSTSPGTEYVAYNKTFEGTEGRVLSPDGSIDISGTYYKDSSWYFYQQKHELEWNSTALSLAMNLALGRIKTVDDCDNLQEDGIYYPQFNGARNIRDLKRDYIPAYEAYIAEGGKVTEQQAAVYEAAKAMMNSTVNNYDADNALIEEFYNVLVDLGIKEAKASESVFMQLLTLLLKAGNSVIDRIFGSKGFFDKLKP